VVYPLSDCSSLSVMSMSFSPSPFRWSWSLKLEGSKMKTGIAMNIARCKMQDAKMQDQDEE
jgi:hypothetical protein